jgi:hypothetical protein
MRRLMTAAEIARSLDVPSGKLFYALQTGRLKADVRIGRNFGFYFPDSLERILSSIGSSLSAMQYSRAVSNIAAREAKVSDV